MKVTQMSERAHMLTALRFVNCYLVGEDDGFTLVDASLRGQGQRIMQAARRLSMPITRIALTHAHVDHVGAVDELHAVLPSAELAISARDARFLTGDMSLDPDEPQVKLRGGYPRVATTPDVLFHEGDRVGSLEVIATPGHTPGHCSFLDTRDGTLYAGDAFQTLGGVAVSGTFVPLFPLPAMATWDKSLALESAIKLQTRRPAMLAVGHGRAIVDPGAVIDRAIARARTSLRHDKAS